ncbi:MAG: DsbA family protein [Patescibacteria group bacterium]
MEQNEPRASEFQLTLPMAVILAGIIIGGTILYANRSPVPTDNQPAAAARAVKADVSADDDPVLGDPSAKVTIIEFSDFQCPYCRRFWQETLGQLKKEYIDTGKVKLVYRDFPLSFHPAAEPSAQAAECADDQGKFWEYHDKIFEGQIKLGTGTVQYGATELKKWAQELGLNTVQFNGCLDANTYKEEVAKDQADGSAAGVTGTPAFFINGNLLVGAQPFSAFKAAIDAELK